MTREEAITLLDDLIGLVEDNHGRDYDRAFHMAIEALEQEPRAKGEWIPVKGTSLQTCSECSFCMCKHNEADNFCPNCGADMRGW